MTIWIALAWILLPNAAEAQPGMQQEDSVAMVEDSLFYPVYNYEYIPDVTYAEAEKRMASLKTEMPVSYNERVKAFIDYFTVKDRDYTRMVVQRSTYYFPLFEEILEKYDMPEELKYLAIVESGLSPTARSWAAAIGLWQFIYTTGRNYGLHADWFIDERMDPHKSTEAACRFISDLYQMFGDWELALAAYNCGPGNVRRAIRRSGYKKSFWEIYRYLPRETRGYVPQFMAFVYIFHHLEDHNFYFDATEFKYPVLYDTIMVTDYLDLQYIADTLNICLEDLQNLNTSIKKDALPKLNKPYQVNIPSEVYPLFVAKRQAILDSSAVRGKRQIEYLAKNSPGSTYGRDKIVHRVRSGEVLGTIAQQYRVRVSDIRRWNNLNGNLIRVGQRLNIWLQPGLASKQAAGPPPKPVTTIVNGTKYHIVQPGDTLWSISRIYEGLSIEKIKKLNNLAGHQIKPGQKLVVG
jgi:membrane-bound lytic murein transglycosylase D